MKSGPFLSSHVILALAWF